MADFIPGGYGTPAPIPGVFDNTRIARPITRTTSPVWLRRKVRSLIVQTDMIGGQCRVMADQIRQLQEEDGIARRNERKLSNELDDAKRRRNPDFAELKLEHAAAAERCRLAEEDMRATQAQLDAMARIRNEANRSTEAILAQLSDAGTIAHQLKEVER